MTNLKPIQFTGYPWGSIFQNHESEVIARNIMIILARTGNTFRELTYNEYKQERFIDEGMYPENEKPCFEKVSYLALGKEEDLKKFCPDWSKKINDDKEN